MLSLIQRRSPSLLGVNQWARKDSKILLPFTSHIGKYIFKNFQNIQMPRLLPNIF
jgi:hypothetical protein